MQSTGISTCEHRQAEARLEKVQKMFSEGPLSRKIENPGDYCSDTPKFWL